MPEGMIVSALEELAHLESLDLPMDTCNLACREGYEFMGYMYSPRLEGIANKYALSNILTEGLGNFSADGNNLTYSVLFMVEKNVAERPDRKSVGKLIRSLREIGGEVCPDDRVDGDRYSVKFEEKPAYNSRKMPGSLRLDDKDSPCGLSFTIGKKELGIRYSRGYAVWISTTNLSLNNPAVKEGLEIIEESLLAPH